MSGQQPDTKPGFYYVSVIDGARHALLSGPYVNDHAGALADVDQARRIACEADPRGVWYAFGTARTDDDSGPGLLQRHGRMPAPVQAAPATQQGGN